ncbi:Gfo/Idh/MocA family protein [Pirellulaceae bacterium SH449]
MKWGFLGIGRVTERMANLINAMPEHELTVAVGRDLEKLSTWGTRFSPANLTTNLDEVCLSSDVEAVYIALPPHLHTKYAIAAMNSGKAVLCEKPLATNAPDARSIFETASLRNSSCHHATSFPYHPRSLAMRSMLQSGRLGKLRRVTIACSASHIMTRGNDHRLSPELGGGCLLDLGWYCVYATLWFTGLKPLNIAAFGTKEPTSQIWTSAQALVQLEGGVIAHWDCGFDAAGRKWIEFAGSDASMICDDFLRPWDSQKPRFWIHGHDGKALCETIPSERNQEEIMLNQIQPEPTKASQQSLELAVQAQQILDLWESELIDNFA